MVKIYNNMKIKKCSKAVVSATSPAPWNKNLWSDSRLFVIRRAARMPATATDAVPSRHTHTHTHTARHTFMGHVITKGKGKEAYLYRAFYIL